MAFDTQLLSALAAGGRNSGAIQTAIQSATQGQNKANKLNDQRYQQGLSELFGAEDLIKQNGAAGLTRINRQEQDNAGKTAQSVVSRGLTNTTISDALQRGVQRDGNDARQQLQEGINTQQATAKGNIADFIAARNDVGPDTSLLSGLVQGAASDTTGAKRTGSVTRQSVPGLGGSASSNGLPSNFSGGGGNGGGGPGGYYVKGPDQPAAAPSLLSGGGQTTSPISSALAPAAQPAADPNSVSAALAPPSAPVRLEGNTITNQAPSVGTVPQSAYAAGFKPMQVYAGLSDAAAKQGMWNEYTAWLRQKGGK